MINDLVNAKEPQDKVIQAASAVPSAYPINSHLVCACTRNRRPSPRHGIYRKEVAIDVDNVAVVTYSRCGERADLTRPRAHWTMTTGESP